MTARTVGLIRSEEDPLATNRDVDVFKASLPGATLRAAQRTSRAVAEAGRAPTEPKGGKHAPALLYPEHLCNHILAEGAAQKIEIGSFIGSMEHIALRATYQHGRPIDDELVEQVLAHLAVRPLRSTDDGRRRHGLIRGANLSLRQTVEHIISTVATDPSLGSLLEAVQFDMEMLEIQPLMVPTCNLWMFHGSRRYGWNYSGKAKYNSTDAPASSSPLVRATHIGAALFTGFGKLWADTQIYLREKEMAEIAA